MDSEDDFHGDTEWKTEKRDVSDEWESSKSNKDIWLGRYDENDPQGSGDNVANRGENDEPLEVFSETFVDRGTVNRTQQLEPVEPGEIHTLSVGYGHFLKKMSREGWGSERPLPRLPLLPPISKIRFTYTGTPTCSTNEECIMACRNIQKYFMDLGFADIPYNFLIGGDGVLYHGRGWQKQADRPPSFRSLRKTCIDIAYIGTFEDEKVPYSMLAIGADFLKYGLKIGKITPFYQAYSFVGDKHV